MEDYTIRPVTPDDAERLLEIYAWYVRETAVTFEYDVPSLEEFRSRIVHITAKYPYLALEKDGLILGYAYAGTFKARAAYDWAVELTIYLDHTMTRHGLGRPLYTALENALAGMGILNLYACIAYPEADDEYLTKNSAEFHEHLGYQTVGLFHHCGYKFNRWYHMIWMEKLIGRHLGNTPPVVPFPLTEQFRRLP